MRNTFKEIMMRRSKIFLPVMMTMFLAGGTLLATNAISAPHDGPGRHGGPAMQGDMDDCPGMMGGYGMMGGPGMGGCPGMAGHGAKISPEQQQKVQALFADAETRLQPLRDKLFVKKHELRALENATNPDVAAVAKKAEEITAIRAQMRQERMDLGTKLDKELGLKPGTHGFMGGKGHRGGHGPY